jgi:hypothetical protein
VTSSCRTSNAVVPRRWAWCSFVPPSRQFLNISACRSPLPRPHDARAAPQYGVRNRSPIRRVTAEGRDDRAWNSYAPIAAPADGFLLSSDPAFDERVFRDSASATEHLGELDGLLDTCTGYDYEAEDGIWSTAVTPAPALDVPDSVCPGMVAEPRVGGTSEADIQRGNLVVRLVLITDGDGPTEQQFRQFAEEYAALLAELEPAA